MSSTQSAMDLIQFGAAVGNQNDLLEGSINSNKLSKANDINELITNIEESESGSMNKNLAQMAQPNQLLIKEEPPNEFKIMEKLGQGSIGNTEQSITYITESLKNCQLHKSQDEILDIDCDDDDDDDYMDDLHEVPLADEEDDYLAPLMTDNHTVIEHQEDLKPVSSVFDASRINEIPEFQPYYLPSRRNLSNKDSVDSDLSMSYDRRNSHEVSNPSGGDSSDAISSDENAKDSGCDVLLSSNKQLSSVGTENDKENEEDDEPIEIPDGEMAEKIVEQVEFYFSNENILKDAFLLKHVRRNKEGFVSLKLISSFKRVRQLTKDWRVVGYAIKLKSKNIEMNDLGTKVRRLEPLPVFDETMPSRTVVATDLPLDKVTIEKVSDLFAKCGEIALIRILRPGGSIPADVRQFINKYPELQQRECALVEFTESSAARNAQNMGGSMQVYEMIAPKKKTGKKASVTKLIEHYRYNGNNQNDAERSRGGNGGTMIDNEFRYNNNVRRNSSGFYAPRLDSVNYVCPQRKYSFNNNVNSNNENYDHFNRRISNCSVNSTDLSRKYSNCSEGYSSCSDMSRRPSNCSTSTDMSRRPSSNFADNPFRRISNCSDYCPSCSRRTSQCSDSFNPSNRRISQCSEHGRRFSNTSIQSYDRRTSTGSFDNGRRLSFEQDFDRKLSMGSYGNGGDGINGFEPYRKISSSYYDPTRKFSNSDPYYGRRTSTDSGYDRKSSVGSMNDFGTSPRTRNISITGPGKIENLVRTPIGPDGSKGFGSRARRVGQVIGPV